MSVPMDLVQLRWQQIRVVEASQVTERENVALRKQLADIKGKSSQVGAEVLKKFVSKVETFIIKSKTDTGKLKLHCVCEFNKLVHQQSILKAAFEQAIRIIDDKDSQLINQRAEAKLISVQLAEAKQQTKVVEKECEAKIAKYKTRIDEMKTERTDLQYKNGLMLSEQAGLAKKNEELTASKEKADAKYETLSAECKRLQTLLNGMEEEHNQEMSSMQASVMAQMSAYEQKIDDLSYENQYLRTIIAEQEEQIARLSNALIGNKSHFAKFVEVKTENLTLQAKLDAMAKGRNNYSNALLTGGSFTTDNPSNLPTVDGRDPSSSSNNSMLPAYQKLRCKIAVTNSNMTKIIDAGGSKASGGSSVDTRRTFLCVPPAHQSGVPSLPFPRRESQSANSVVSDVSESPRSSMAGSKLSSFSGGSSPRATSVSVKSSAQLPPNPDLVIGAVPQCQNQHSHPHPPLINNPSEGIAGATGSSAGAARKSMRPEQNRPRASFVSSAVTQQLQQQQSEATQQQTPYSIVPGVPLLNKQTRESLRERVVI